ncbi:MAG: nucleotidyltransferase [Rhizobium sp.]|nr:nucleotidyltransferase [Rhizobium sp.]
MNIRETTQVQLAAEAAAFLERLASELDVSPRRYEEAKNRYISVGDWLGRDESSLKDHSPEVYVQGSFRLGTPIRPLNDEEHYDIDLVCELGLKKGALTQQELKCKLGHEMQLYAKAHGMKNGVSEGRRCWTLEYADEAQFHLDALPAVPDGEGMRLQLAERHVSSDWADTAIAITDNEHSNYGVVCRDWPHSNPKGYTNWFRSRMKVSFESLRAAMALEAKANVEDVPAYRVKTPLQQAVQILKRHRDVMFADDADDKPISIIISTLAGLSYGNESNVGHALLTILASMDKHITVRNGVYWVQNPTDPLENFADRWQTHLQRREKFLRWLDAARADFAELAVQTNRASLTALATTLLGGAISSRDCGSTWHATHDCRVTVQQSGQCYPGPAQEGCPVAYRQARKRQN